MVISMNLPVIPQTVRQMLEEFDVWITPSLGEIRETDRFQQELQRVTEIFDTLCEATENFRDPHHCQPDRIAETFINHIRNSSEIEATTQLTALGAVLFLVTAKSDNNAKCQLPIYLRENCHRENIPSVRVNGASESLVGGPIPRTLEVEKYMRFVARLIRFEGEAALLLSQFINFVISDADYVSQLWSVGRSYAMLREIGNGHARNLLSPLVAFQVRGSVAASGGHNPETLLRNLLVEWGLISDEDFNSADVVVEDRTLAGATLRGPSSTEDSRTAVKTRAFDFVLPYRVDNQPQRIFIQCQYYAGDSGSVSHKNVDQTNSSRQQVLRSRQNPLFVEYVDGAGYFSSLNGDLRKLLEMPTTHSFFQIRSAPIRLRRILQSIDFLTPLEIEQAISRTDNSVAAVERLLLVDGYSANEIQRCLTKSLRTNLIQQSRDQLVLNPARRDIVRRYFLLDLSVQLSREIDRSEFRRGTGILFTPGYGPFYGIEIDHLAEEALRANDFARNEWSNSSNILTDIRWICNKGFAILG